MKPTFRTTALTLLAAALLPLTPSHATETENLGLRLLPAPAGITIDGKADDWNLAAGIFACGDAETLRDKYAVWINGAYDANNLYMLARFVDSTPLNNPSDTKLEFGWAGDSLQVRVISNYGTPDRQDNNINCWQGRDGRNVVELDTPGFTKNSPKGDDIKPLGAQQAFTQNADGSGYVQEIAIPWKYLFKGGRAPKTGDSIILTVEPNFTTGVNSRMSIKDIFRPGVLIDRVFTFTNKQTWGVAPLLATATAEPQPVRLSDGRTFPVTMQGGVPVVDWTGLIKSDEMRGFKPIKFTLPAAGNVSLVIKNSQGEIVRHLLNNAPFKAGESTVRWDGLTEPDWKTPGQPALPGDYTWSAITHKGIGLKWRGVASNAGAVPWDNGPGSNWGGDMGPPDAAAAEGKYVLLGWYASEAGKAVVLCDLNGKPIWSHKRGGFGGALFVGLDNGIAYIWDHTVLYKLSAEKSIVVPFEPGGAGEISFRALLGGDATMPDRAQGFAVKNGKIYVSSSDYSFQREDVTSWRDLLTKLATPSEATGRVWTKLTPETQKRIAEWAADGSKSNNDLAQRRNDPVPDVRDSVIQVFNDLLNDAAVAAPKKLTGGALQENNRRWITAAYPGIAARNTGFVAVCDAASGKVLRKVDVPGAGALAADATGVFAVIDGASLVRIDAAAGGAKPVLKGLQNATGVTVDGAGNFYLAFAAPLSQIRVYSAQGKLLRTIGKQGGRPLLGEWEPNGLLAISGLAVDSENKLWVGENISHPRRFTTWDAATGKLIKEYFGPTRYGASGGAIHPGDPNVMVGEATEWKLDPATGLSTCIGVVDGDFHAFARFAKTANGKDYLAVTVPSYIGGDFSQNTGIKIFERLKPGVYKLRSTIYTYQGNQAFKTEDHTDFWADRNDDEKVQPDEVTTLPQTLLMGGYYLWSMNMGSDLTFYGGSLRPNANALQIKVGGYTPCGAPVFDLKNAKVLPMTQDGLPSLDNRWFLLDGHDAANKQEWGLYDLQSNKRLWGYPNNWMGVHGSHVAPPPASGLMRGTFGIVGTAKLPEPLGDIWAINSNVGEWHLLTRDGFYLSRLFQPDPLKMEFPAQLAPGVDVTSVPSGMGGEDFGGSLQQGTDGKVYIEAGKTGLWNLEVTGLDTVAALPGGKITFTDGDVKTALTLRGSMLQEATGPMSVEARKLTPAFTGKLDADFKGAAIVSYKKSDDAAIRSAATYDDANLYLAWDVTDNTPWTNGAKAAEDLYLNGDTVDFQLGTNPAADKNRKEAGAGDLRLSIGSLGGVDTAVIYRKVSAIKKPRIFSSGVIHEYPMDFVSTVADAKITVTKRGGGYIVEAAIPLTALDFKPAPGLSLRGDFGVTHGDLAGARTRLRSYWSNQETGIVDDAVYELMMQPGNWGEILFK